MKLLYNQKNINFSYYVMLNRFCFIVQVVQAVCGL